LGVALLLRRWSHPVAFLILVSGFGVLLVGGTLVAYPNSVPPLINHWTPSFPAWWHFSSFPETNNISKEHKGFFPAARTAK